MKERVQGAVTAGVALVGAGVMAATPAAQQAPEVLRTVDADVALAASPAPYTQSVPELFALSAQRSVTGFVSAPIGLATAAVALAQGQNLAAQAILNEIVDGPQWAADPAIYALDDIFPEPIGGDEANDPTNPDPDSAISQFRAAVLIAARDDVKEAIGDALGQGQKPDVDNEGAVYAASRLGAGFAVSGMRAAQSAVTAPLGLVAVAQAVQHSFETGDNEPLYSALEAYIDGPNYVIDPIVFAADDVVPAPVGSDPSTDPRNMGTSQISQFRANTLLGARDQVRAVVKSALGVNEEVAGAGVDDKGSSARSLSAATSNDADSTKQDHSNGPVSRVISSLKATPGSASTASTGGKHRAPTAGGLGNLFKKKEDKKAGTTGSDSTSDSGSDTK